MGAGLSHVLEHMLFKGTTTRGVAAIVHAVEDKGGAMNAYTSFENTVYYINMPSAHWDVALDVLADCMMNATIPAEELTKEKEVILREMDMGRDDPDHRVSRLLWATAYSTHPFRHPVIGYPDIYNRTARSDVVAYYKKFYVPNNMVFVVVGDVKASEVEAKLRQLTRVFPMGAIEWPFVPAEPTQLSARSRHEEMSTELCRIQLAWHIPAVTEPDVYPLDVLSIVLGQGRSSRLYREVQQKKGLVHSIGAGSYTPSHPGLFEIEATADPDKREASLAAILAEVTQIKQRPPSKNEMQKAINISTAGHLDRLKTMEGQAFDIGQNQFLLGDPDFSEKYLENLSKVTAEDLQRVAKRYFTEANRTIVTLNPTGTVQSVPSAAPVTGEIRIQKFELANGIRLLVREDPKLPTVHLRALLKGGVLAETETNNGITKLTARLLLKGTTTRTAEQIAETMESVGGDISYYAGNNSFGVAAEALSRDFDRALEVLTDVLLHPSFSEEMLTREREVQLAEIKAEQDQLLRAGQQLLRESLYAKHPYRLNVLGRADTVSKISRKDLAGFHHRSVVPGNLVLAVFGNVHAAEVRREVEAKWGAMKAVPLILPRTAPERLPSSVRKVETRPKEQAVLLVGFTGTDLYSPDRYTLEVLNELYSGMGSRVFLRIRDELGLAYYVGAYQMLGVNSGYFAFFAGTKPETVATCEKEIFSELGRLETQGLSEDELDRAKNSLIGQRRVRMQDNAELSLMIGLDELLGFGHEHFQTLDARYQAVTMEDIRRVSRTYFAGKPNAVVVITPPATKE